MWLDLFTAPHQNWQLFGLLIKLNHIVRSSVQVEVLDSHCQLVSSLTSHKVLADQRLRKLSPFEVLQS